MKVSSRVSIQYVRGSSLTEEQPYTDLETTPHSHRYLYSPNLHVHVCSDENSCGCPYLPLCVSETELRPAGWTEASHL